MTAEVVEMVLFPSRYRAASHFRECGTGTPTAHATVSISLSSGFSFQGDIEARDELLLHVSISLSSGFSFQVRRHFSDYRSECSFHLVIERLFISGYAEIGGTFSSS